MKDRLKRLSLLIAVLSVFALFESEAVAQYVQCKPTGRIFVCTGAPKGGCTCQMLYEQTYILDQPCGTGQKCEGAAHAKSGIKFDEATIIAISQVHPRFAAALAALNRIGGLKTRAQVSMMPARLEAFEAVNWLKPITETESFFREYRSRYVAGAKIIVIEFTLSKVDATRSVIRGNITGSFQDDPPATQLEIELASDRVASWRAY